jgi:hypothetical protein
MLRWAVVGMLLAVLAVFPLAALVALCYRFPIPLSGYESGPNAALRSVAAVIFYGFVGGFIVVALLGAASGASAHRLAGSDNTKKLWLTLALVLVGDLLAVMLLAVLDKFIGNW